MSGLVTTSASRSIDWQHRVLMHKEVHAQLEHQPTHSLPKIARAMTKR
ncbi:hypothetical protein PS723_05184 [Pseudomonas fluorescens]|uniref:Uncharacterized protein n=1 Tax=Pseudomonas fluorescens TaxID=294 RepID=A0A5E7F2F8_PSEFL|nr:hypothetical protein PS723_05184 [Pseudomonas fluorescens]